MHRGMELLEGLPEISPDDADERVLRVFDEQCRKLRVPVVDRMFRTLANFPELLEASWNAVRDVAGTREFEQDADWIRATAVLEPVPIGRDVRSHAGEELDRLRAVTDTVHYALPKMLLVATAFEAMMHTRRADQHAPPEEHLDKAPLPPGPPPGMATFRTISPSDADGQVKELYEDIQRVHGHATVTTWFRALATRPDFLDAVWDELRPIVGSEPWLRRKRLLLNSAEAIVREWDLPDLPPSLISPDARAVVSAYRSVLVPDVLIDACLVKGMLDGGRAAYHSRFSAVAPSP